MRHPILAALVLAALGSNAHAAWLDVTPHAGYTTFAMRDLNSGNASLWGYNMGYQFGNDGQITNGYVVGADLTTSRLTNVKGLHWGLRSEYAQSNLSTFTTDETSGYPIGAQYTDQATLTNLLLGANYARPFAAEGMTLGLGAWIGAGYGVVNQNNTADTLHNASSIQSGAFSAILPVAELEGTVSYSLSQRIGLRLSGGWRWADAPQVTSGGTALSDNWVKWETGNIAPVNSDFSGATAQGSVSYSF